MNRTLFASMAFLVATASACSGGGGSGEKQIDVTGVWELTSGGLFAAGGAGPVTHIEFGDATTGTVFVRSAANVKGCGPIVYGELEDSIVISLPALDTTEAYRAERSGDTLTLVDAAGTVSTFTKIDGVPAAVACENATVVSQVELQEPPNYWTNLVFDGANLRYTADDGRVWSVDPATGTTNGSIDLGSGYRYVQAMQGGDFWSHCACGNIGEIERRTSAGAFVDLVDTGTDLSHSLSVYGAAWDGSNLWLHGNGELLKVNATSEPDALLTTFDTGLNLKSLAWDGNELWAVVYSITPTLVAIDPATGLVARSVSIPGAESINALAVVNGDIYYVDNGYDGDQSLLTHITIPGGL